MYFWHQFNFQIRLLIDIPQTCCLALNHKYITFDLHLRKAFLFLTRNLFWTQATKTRFDTNDIIFTALYHCNLSAGFSGWPSLEQGLIGSSGGDRGRSERADGTSVMDYMWVKPFPGGPAEAQVAEGQTEWPRQDHQSLWINSIFFQYLQAAFSFINITRVWFLFARILVYKLLELAFKLIQLNEILSWRIEF